MESVMKGWLIKSPPEYKGSFKLFSGKWRRRYFVLYAPPFSIRSNVQLAEMLYYSKSKMENKIGFINLVDCDEVLSNIRTDIYKFVFSMRTKHKGLMRTYFFAPDTEWEMTMWVDKLCHVLGLKENEKISDNQRFRVTSAGPSLISKQPPNLLKHSMYDDSALLKSRNQETLKKSLRGAESTPHLDRNSGMPPPLPPDKRREWDEPKKPSRDKKNKSTDDLRNVEGCRNFDNKDIHNKNLLYDAPSISKSLDNLNSYNELLFMHQSKEKSKINVQISDNISYSDNNLLYDRPEINVNQINEEDLKKKINKINAKISFSHPDYQYEQMYDRPSDKTKIDKEDLKKEINKINAKISFSHPDYQYEQMYDRPSDKTKFENFKKEMMNLNTPIYNSVISQSDLLYDQPGKTKVLDPGCFSAFHDKSLNDNKIKQTQKIQYHIDDEGIYNKPKNVEKGALLNKNDNFEIYNSPKANSKDIYNNVNSNVDKIKVSSDKDVKWNQETDTCFKTPHQNDFQLTQITPVIGRKAQNYNLRANNNLFIQPKANNNDNKGAEMTSDRKLHENFKLSNENTKIKKKKVPTATLR